MGDMRGQESPMDYIWENGHGPIDTTSPWQISRNQLQHTPSKQRPSSTFDMSLTKFSTPSKQPVFSTPATSRPFATPFTATPFNATPSQLRSPSPLKHNYREPSTPGESLDTDNEAPETPDVDMATPDANMDHILHRTPRAAARALQEASVRVTGRGEIRRGRDLDRIAKHTRRKSLRRVYITDDEDDDESDYPTPNYEKRRRSRVRSRARSRRRVRDLDDDDDYQVSGWDAEKPLIASSWINFTLSFFFGSVIVLVIGAFVYSMWVDVRHKMEEHSAVTLQRIHQCQKSYVENRCAPHIRVPAMEIQCEEWDLCMNQDPAKVGRAKVAVAVVAEILNSFTDILTYKTMLFVLLFSLGGFWISYGRGVSRAKAMDHPHPYLAAAAPPPMDIGGSWTPHHHSMQPGTPWMTPGYATPAGDFCAFRHTPGQVDPVAKKLEFKLAKDGG